MPRRKLRCPACGQLVWVRTRRSNRQRILAAEEKAEFYYLRSHLPAGERILVTEEDARKMDEESKHQQLMIKMGITQRQYQFGNIVGWGRGDVSREIPTAEVIAELEDYLSDLRNEVGSVGYCYRYFPKSFYHRLGELVAEAKRVEARIGELKGLEGEGRYGFPGEGCC
jgi:hypothetical protein